MESDLKVVTDQWMRTTLRSSRDDVKIDHLLRDGTTALEIDNRLALVGGYAPQANCLVPETNEALKFTHESCSTPFSTLPLIN